MKLLINGEPVTISDIKPYTKGIVNVYVDNFSSCHSVPFEALKRRGVFFTGGNRYQVMEALNNGI